MSDQTSSNASQFPTNRKTPDLTCMTQFRTVPEIYSLAKKSSRPKHAGCIRCANSQHPAPTETKCFPTMLFYTVLHVCLVSGTNEAVAKPVVPNSAARQHKIIFSLQRSNSHPKPTCMSTLPRPCPSVTKKAAIALPPRADIKILF